jgi:hypothetical protein
MDDIEETPTTIKLRQDTQKMIAQLEESGPTEDDSNHVLSDAEGLAMEEREMMGSTSTDEESDDISNYDEEEYDAKEAMSIAQERTEEIIKHEEQLSDLEIAPKLSLTPLILSDEMRKAGWKLPTHYKPSPSDLPEEGRLLPITDPKDVEEYACPTSFPFSLFILLSMPLLYLGTQIPPCVLDYSVLNLSK